MKNLPISEPTIFNHLTDKENRNNRTDGKRVLDARKPQEGPRESREERNNRRNKQGESGAPFDAEKGGRGGLGRGAGRGGGKSFLTVKNILKAHLLYIFEGYNANFTSFTFIFRSRTRRRPR